MESARRLVVRPPQLGARWPFVSGLLLVENQHVLHGLPLAFVPFEVTVIVLPSFETSRFVVMTTLPAFFWVASAG